MKMKMSIFIRLSLYLGTHLRSQRVFVRTSLLALVYLKAACNRHFDSIIEN